MRDQIFWNVLSHQGCSGNRTWVLYKTVSVLKCWDTSLAPSYKYRAIPCLCLTSLFQYLWDEHFFLSLQFYLGPQSLNFMVGTINHKIFSLYLNSLINVLNYHKGNNWDADFVCLFWGRVYFTAVIQDVGTGARRQYLMCRSWRSPVKTFLPLSSILMNIYPTVYGHFGYSNFGVLQVGHHGPFFCAHTFVHICWLYCQKWDFWVIGNKFFNFSNYRGMDFSVAAPVYSPPIAVLKAALFQILTDVWNSLPLLHAGRGTVVPVCNSVFPRWHTESYTCGNPLQAPARVICPSFHCLTCLWSFWTCWLLFVFFFF